MKKLFGFTAFLLPALLAVFILKSFISPTPAYALPANFIEKTVASEFDQPVDIAETPDNRIFVLEKNGTIKIFQNGTVSPTPLMCGSKTNGCPVKINVDVFQERGALGLALDPDFGNNHFFYLIYVNANPLEYHISRFTESNGQAVAGSESILMKLTANQNAGTHMGGGLRFGPDGKLWFTIGDNTLDSSQEPQKLTSPYGKLHRINIDGTIPEDNPFVGQNGIVESIWAYGLRNPFRFSFLDDGRPIIGDVGGSVFEEVNIGVKGGNFGWPICEGSCNQQGFTNPAFQYQHQPDNSGSISGGIIYHGDQFPAEYKGKYFYGDYVRGYIHTLDLNGSTLANDSEFLADAGAVITFMESKDGSIYFIDIFPDGALHKLYYSTENQAPTAKISANPNNGDAPLETQFSSEGSTDPEGAVLNYKWDFGDGGTSTEQNPKHTYMANGKYSAKLTVNDGTLDSSQVSTEISVGNLAPVASILTPVESAHYNAGDVINFSGNGTDREDGELPAGAYSWTITFHHNTHTHPFKGPITGVKGGSITIPDSGESAPDVWYRIYLSVTDSSGLKTTVYRDILPNLANITINSDPVQNMVVNVEGIPFATPYSAQIVVGYNLSVEAQSPLDREGKTYTFDHWSDNGDRIHQFTVPGGDTTLTAFYKTVDDGGIVTQNTIIAGDVKVDGIQLYDDDPKTGLVVLLEQEATVEAPWGATFIPNPDRATADQNLTAIVEQLKIQGCDGGCSDVKVINWPTDKPIEKIYQIAPGQKITVDQNSVVIGDIKINGESLYDDEVESGLITLMEQNGEVEAHWGAVVIRNNSSAEAEATLQNEAANLKDEGCGGNCLVVTTVHWPSEKPANKISELKPGEKKLLPKFAVISGDIKVNGKALYDDIETTGLVTVLESEGEVEAPWGATYNLNSDQPSVDIATLQLVTRVKNNGCLSGCSSVTTLHWPTDFSQNTSAMLKQWIHFVDNLV